MSTHFADDVLGQVSKEICNDPSIPESVKSVALSNLVKLKGAKVNVLMTGATGSGKSSTINALFNSDKAKVGQGADPETMDIVRYDFESMVLFDSPGLGDGKEADNRHARNIIKKLHELDAEGRPLIDLVMVILDGSSRDLGTSFQLINEVIIPNLGEDKGRLLVAINQADMAMKGRYWNDIANRPEPELISFLDEKVASTKARIKEATGVDVDPIYYAAGYKDGSKSQHPYNMSKLLLSILQHIRSEKRVVIMQDINQNRDVWESDDGLQNYGHEIRKNVVQSIIVYAETGGMIGAAVGSLFGPAGAALGKTVGRIGGALVGFISSIF